MNSEIEIVDFSEKYISDVLNVLYESNILHIKSDPDYFAKTGKERSLPYLYWILHDPKISAMWRCVTARWRELCWPGLKNAMRMFIGCRCILRFTILPSAAAL